MGEIVETVEDEATPSIILKFKTRRFAESAMLTGKSYGERVLTLSWYNQPTPELQEVDEVVEQFPESAAPEEDDDYTPPGLQEHEDHLSQPSHDEQDDVEADELNGTGDGEVDGGEELNEDLLDDEDEDGEDEERSWKRRNASNEEDKE